MMHRFLLAACCSTGILVAMSLLSCDAMVSKRSPGETLFRKHCASCHGVNAEGHTVRYMGNENADLTDNNWEHGGDANSIEDVIESDLVSEHPSFDKLSSQDIRQIVDHLLSIRGELR